MKNEPSPINTVRIPVHMTFTFKLARRLAQCHIMAVVAGSLVLGGCAPGKPLEGGLEPPPPDSVLSVQLFPDSVALNPSEFVDFTAIGEFPGGGNSAVPVTWEAQGGAITSDGRYTAGSTSGEYLVIGRGRNGKSDTSKVTIKQQAKAPVLTSIAITPSSAALLPGDTQAFSATGVMSDGSTAGVTVTWASTGGTIDGTGLYTAPSTAGSYLVVATQQGGSLADTAQVNVSVPPPTLTGVSLTPATAALEFGQTRQFSVLGLLSDGTTTTIAVTWTASGGTVNSTGLYTAGSTAGTFRLIAKSANGLADTSSITVTAPTVTAITLTPATVSLQSGQTQQFSAAASLSNGTTQTNPVVTWLATGGSINSTGLYTAGLTAGTFTVIATSTNGKADTSAVTVSLPTVTSIVVTPASTSVSPAQTLQFSATATLSNGSTQISPAVTWSATGGSVSTAGLYTAGSTTGTFRVIAASSNGPADTSAVTITVATPTVTGIVVTPATATVASGQTQQFTASATMSDGTTQSNPAVTWTATGGAVTTAGLYTAGTTAGTFRVIATGSGKADTSTVTIPTATVTGIAVSPGSATVVTSGTQQFTAAATLSNGTTQSNTSVTWSATGGTVSTSGLYTAGTTTGTFRVIAVQQGGTLADTSAVTISTVRPNNMYYNSSEPGCDGSDPNVLLCDDFEDGTWYEKNCDQANASGGLLQTDGWCGTIYGDPISPAGAATCGSAGAAGTNCAANGGLHDGSTGGVNMADHNLGPNGNGYNEIWLRYYIKALPGYVYGAQKMITINATSAGSGGISIGGSGSPFGDGAYDTCPVYDCNTTGEIYYYRQNQSQVLKLSQILGHWAYVEMHIKLNTPGQKDGIWELWINDCGTTGVCTGTPTLRSHYTTVEWQGPTDNKQIRSLWFENWANPGSVGTELYDQIKVSKGGQIGFAP
jgi:Big-like domain-containing protein